MTNKDEAARRPEYDAMVRAIRDPNSDHLRAEDSIFVLATQASDLNRIGERRKVIKLTGSAETGFQSEVVSDYNTLYQLSGDLKEAADEVASRSQVTKSCSHCERAFATESGLENHISVVHETAAHKYKKGQNASGEPDVSAVCATCGQPEDADVHQEM